MKKKIAIALTHKVADFQLILTLLNVMYGVFLGVFAQYIVEFTTSTNTTSIHFLINSENIFFVAMFFFYFIVDWFSANITLIFEKGTNHLLLIFAIIFIFWLGFMLIIALDPKSYLFLSFGVYSAIASSMDIELRYKVVQEGENLELKHFLNKIYFFIFRFFFSLALILFSILLMLNPDNLQDKSSKIACYIIFISLIVLKVFRYFWLVYLKNNHECIKSATA